MKVLDTTEVHTLMPLIQALREEKPEMNLVTPEQMVAKIASGIAQRTGFAIVEDMKGFIFVTVSASWAIDEKAAVVPIVYVDPAHRRQGVASMLLQRATIIAQSWGAKSLYIAAPANTKISYAWMKQGASEVETYYKIIT